MLIPRANSPSDCQRPQGWCSGADYRTIDCDEDGFKDCLCTEKDGRIHTRLSSKSGNFQINDGPGTAQCKAIGNKFGQIKMS